jgi:hypothetical protein
MEKTFNRVKTPHLIMLFLIFILTTGMNNANAQQPVNINKETSVNILRAQQSVPEAFLKEAKVARVFEINPVLQRVGSVNMGDIVNLQLFENDVYTAQISSMATDVNGNFTLTLKLPEYPMSFAYITTNRAGKSLVNVSIPEKNRTFSSKCGIYSDTSYLIEIDKTQCLSLENDAIEIPQGIELIDEENSNTKNTLAQNAPLQIQSGTCIASGSPTAPAQIDILIVYTPAAAAWAENEGGIANTIAGVMEKNKRSC